LLEADAIELMVVFTVEVTPHSYIRSKAPVILACRALALKVIPNISVVIRDPQAGWSSYVRYMLLAQVFGDLVETVNMLIVLAIIVIASV
jgi:hypothetical protein